jgi:uncharacterized delta-60 repeat protein
MNVERAADCVPRSSERRIRRSIVAALLATACVLALPQAQAQAASRDSIGGLAVQPDGKIVAAGLATSNSFGLARYLPDGSLDPTFSGDGKLTDAFGGKAEATSVALQPDGKIVVAGNVEDLETGTHAFGLARYTSEGTLDPTFSGDGFTAIPIAPNCECIVYAFASSVVIQPNGSIVVAGSANFRGAVVRLLSDGTLDPSFSEDGILTFSDGNEGIAGIALQADGKIVATGRDSLERIYVVRLNADGSFDTTFSGDGKVNTAPAAFNSGAAIAIQSDGKIVVAGDSGDAYTNDYTAVRYLTDGTLDSSFSGDGIATADIGGFDIANSIAIQSNGDILLGGEEFGSFAVARFLSNGSLDSTFSGDGILTDHPEYDGRSVKVQADGAILVGGDTQCCQAFSDFAVSRYTALGVKDSSLGTGGDVTTDFSEVEGSIEAPPSPSAPPPPTENTQPLPNTTLGSHPPAKLTTKSAKAKVKFKFSSSTPGTTFKCKLDKGAFKPCQSPKSYKVKPGKHVFTVEAIDAAGADSTPVSFKFRVNKGGHK